MALYRKRTKPSAFEDEEIIRMYWRRDENAIRETDLKYGGYLFAVAYRIVRDRRDCEEAERLLYSGYVFGGHTCPFCMAEQKKVDFHGYDFVGLEYIFSMDDRKGTEAVPFYAFYKKIGTAGNGNLIYARTYVPAFAVSGYREYFEKQKEAHA